LGNLKSKITKSFFDGLSLLNTACRTVSLRQASVKRQGLWPAPFKNQFSNLAILFAFSSYLGNLSFSHNTNNTSRYAPAATASSVYIIVLNSRLNAWSNIASLKPDTTNAIGRNPKSA